MLTNTPFALIQFLIGFGIVWKRTLQAGTGLSIAWSLGVWWFGEGLRRDLHRAGPPRSAVAPAACSSTPFSPSCCGRARARTRPFVAARTVGVKAARAIWVVVWGLLALLSVVGSGRSPQALHDLVAGLNSGQPGWLAHIDRSTESLFLHHGTTAAILLAVVCLVVAAGVFLPPQFTQVTLVLAIAVFAVIWVAVQNFGGILAGGATDPNSGPLVILLALIYWPLTTTRMPANGASSSSPSELKEVLIP